MAVGLNLIEDDPMVMEKRVEQIAQLAAVALLVAGCLLVLRPFVTAMLSAAIVCFTTWPIYQRLVAGLRGRRTVAALIMTLLLILVIILPLAFIAFTLADAVGPLIEWLRGMLVHGLPMLPEWVRAIPLAGDSLDVWWRDVASSKEKLADLLQKLAHPAQQGAINFGLLLGEGVLEMSLVSFLGFFFYRDGEALVTSVRSAMKRVAGDLEPGLMLTVGGTIQGVVYGLVGTAIAQGLLALIGFLIAGIPGAMLLGFLTFVLSIVPIGPPLLWGGATAWLIYQDQMGWAIFMAAWGFFLISGIDNVIKPLLISRGSNLPFVLVLIGVFGGVVAFGFVGIFIGPTLMAIGYTLAQRWTNPPVETSSG